MTENKYSRGKIYRLVNNVDDEFYIGSTCETLARRKAGHKKRAELKPERNIYNHFNNIGWDNVCMVLIENYPCNSIEELKARERYWIEILKPSLNKQLPLRSKKEYYEKNKDKIKQYMTEYQEQNKDTLRKYKQEYRQQNKEQLSQKAKEWREKNKEHKTQMDKEYREKNKERKTQKDKEYYEKNKDKIKEYRCQKIKCECGCELQKNTLSNHKKTKKHQEWLSNQPSTSS